MSETASWSAPGSEFTVVYPLPMLHEIEFDVSEGYRRIPRGGIEIGGLLFGRIDGATIRIEARRPIECEHVLGPSFKLSEKDMAGVRAQLLAAQSDGEIRHLEPVGWFIAHTRSELVLSELEAEQFDELFTGSGKLTLLAKPEKFKPTLFSFLIRASSGETPRDGSGQAFILPLPGRAGSANLQAPIPVPPPPEPQRSRTVDEAAKAPSEMPLPPPITASEPARPPEPEQPKPKRSEPALAPLIEPELKPDLDATLSSKPTPQASPPVEVPERTRVRMRPSMAELLRDIETAASAEANPEPPTLPVVTEPIMSEPVLPEPVKFTTEASITPPPVELKSEPIVPEPAPTVAAEAIGSPEPVPAHPSPETSFDSIGEEVLRRRRRRSDSFDEPASLGRVLQPRKRHSYLALLLFISVLLGCALGYWLYTQMPPGLLAVKLDSRDGKYLISWPPDQTRGADAILMRVNDGEPTPLPVSDQLIGRTEIPATDPHGVKIEIIARHKIRDSRGIVRYLK
jgi:hypothetical protein